VKRLSLLITVTLMTVSLLLGCAGAARTYTDSGRAINISQGKEFIIALGSNPTTGYSWQANYDNSLLSLVESKYEPGKEAQAGLVGAGGIEYFRFRALGKGKTEITMLYKRRWEEASANQKLFTVSIN